MKRLIILPLTFAVVAIGTPVQAQSKYDVCAAYARDAMMAFYSSSAVPVPRAARMWNAPPRPMYGRPTGFYPPRPGEDSLRYHFDQCWHGRFEGW